MHILCRRNKPQTLIAVQEVLTFYSKKFVFAIFVEFKSKKYIYLHLDVTMAVGGLLLVILVLNVVPTKAYNSIRNGKTVNEFVLHVRLKQSEFLRTFWEANYLYGIQCIKSIISSPLGPV